MKNTSDFRHQCALLGITRDTIDSKIIIVPEPKFWRARAMSDIDCPVMLKYSLRKLEGLEIPCKLMCNDDDTEYRGLEVENITALAFIAYDVVRTEGLTLILHWISDRFGWSGTQQPRIPFAIVIECRDGSTTRLTATTNTAEEAELLIKSIIDKH